MENVTSVNQQLLDFCVKKQKEKVKNLVDFSLFSISPGEAVFKRINYQTLVLDREKTLVAFI